MNVFSSRPFGKMLVGAVAFAILAFATCPSMAQDMKPVFPKTNNVPGWERIEDSWQVANNKDLTPVFDGGYQIYLDFGLQTVGAFTYQAPGAEDRISMMLMFFPKKENARSHFSYLASSIPDDAKDLEMSDTAFSYASAGIFQSYALDDTYLGTIVCSGDSQEMRDASIVMMDNFTTKIRGWTDGLAASFVLPTEGMRRHSYTCAIYETTIKHIYPMLAAAKLDEDDEVTVTQVDGAKYGDPFNCSLVMLNCGEDEGGAKKCLEAIVGSTEDRLVEHDEDLSLSVYNNESAEKFWAVRSAKTNVLVAYGAAEADQAKALLTAAVEHLEKSPEEEGDGERQT